MTCAELEARLPEIVDDTLGRSARADVDAHLGACEDCRRLAADLTRIRETASALDRLPVPPTVWSRLRQQVEDENVGLDAVRARASRVPPWAWMATAAALTLAIGVAIWSVQWMATGAPAPATSAAATANPGTDALVSSIEAELEAAATHYEKAIEGLERIAAGGDARLDPVLMATLQESLAVIDGAIDESRAALRAQPESRVVQESLFEAFRRKIALVQDTIALMNELRKGDEAGAARIIGDLEKS
jgi:hypothetical protein